MKVIITRHGETEENLQGILQGHLHGTLSKNGIEQAKKVALRLKDEKIDIIYSSDLGRSADTTKEIAKFHPNIQLIFTKELREKDFGEFTGKNLKDIYLDVGKKGGKFIKSKDAETIEEMHVRAKKFIDKIITKHKQIETILFVAHYGFNKALIAVLAGKPLNYISDLSEKQHQCCINILEIDPKTRACKIDVLNSTKHLED